MFEYKQAEKLSDTKGVAKSIASFANSHGGWLFVGIEAGDRNEPELDPIQGIPDGEGQLTERVSQLSQSRLSPPPYLNVAAVGLGGGGAVLLVHVPESPTPPHIALSDGKVHMPTQHRGASAGRTNSAYARDGPAPRSRSSVSTARDRWRSRRTRGSPGSGTSARWSEIACTSGRSTGGRFQRGSR